jgi:hypothetical protein
MPTLNELGESLRAQLAEVLIGGDDSVKSSPNSFITWMSPGMPFEASDFDFAVQGLGSGATAEDERRLLNQAYLFSTLVDFAPDATGMLSGEQQQALYRTSQARMSHLYGEILRLSRVADKELTADEQAKLDNWRGKLQTTTKVKDVVTDEEKEVVEDSPLVKAYTRYQEEFRLAKMQYNAKRVAAMVATGAEGKAAVMDWSTNAELYRMAVTQAEGKWGSVGHRSDVERLWAAINQVTGRSMRLWKERLIQAYSDARLSGTLPGSSFYPATLYPANFANASGWTGLKVHSWNNVTSVRDKHKSWSAGGGLKMGFWKASGGVKSDVASHLETASFSDFELSFELAQVSIIRASWFYPEFFVNRGWTLDPGHGWHFDKLPSDGNNPPDGLLVGYPTTMVFVRNVTIKSKELVTELKTFAKSLDGKASAGIGPFSIKGKYANAESGRDFTDKGDENTYVIPGMQWIASVNQFVGGNQKVPNPSPELQPEDFV